jgi:hypothetical protein
MPQEQVFAVCWVMVETPLASLMSASSSRSLISRQSMPR